MTNNLQPETIEFIDNYIEFTEKTTVYPKEKALEYLIIGMNDELNEVADSPTAFLDKKELGDLGWYIFSFIRIFYIENPFDYVEDYKTELLSLGFTGNENLVSMIRYTLSRLKKHIRGDEDYTLHITELVLIIADMYISYIILNFGEQGLVGVLQDNQEKLLKRLDENKIHGDGDNR